MQCHERLDTVKVGEQIPHDTGVFLVLTMNLHEKIIY